MYLTNNKFDKWCEIIIINYSNYYTNLIWFISFNKKKEGIVI